MRTIYVENKSAYVETRRKIAEENQLLLDKRRKILSNIYLYEKLESRKMKRILKKKNELLKKYVSQIKIKEDVVIKKEAEELC